VAIGLGCVQPLPLSAQDADAGFTLAAKMRVSAFRRSDAPAVLVHAPAGFDRRLPLHLVVFLHGYNNCVEVVAASGPARCRPDDPERDGYGISARHDEAHTNTLLVIPQLAFNRREGDPGCFGRPGCFRRFLQELLGETLQKQLGGARSLRDVGSVTLVAHSAGYRSALAILQRGEVSSLVHNVVLMDALYGEAEDYARWLVHARDDTRMVSIYLGGTKTAAGNRTLLRMVKRSFGSARVRQLDAKDLPRAVAPLRLVVATGHTPHRLVPEGYLSTVLGALGLPARQDSPKN
jgi:pimeloyl-ACP methyl ester carboxylesterase